MVAKISNLSRKGDAVPYPLPIVLNQVQSVLEAWVATVNGQNPGQLLTILTKSADDAVSLGWTIKASLLAETSPGVKAKLVSISSRTGAGASTDQPRAGRRSPLWIQSRQRPPAAPPSGSPTLLGSD